MTIVYSDAQSSPPTNTWSLKGGRGYSMTVYAQTDNVRIGPKQIRLDFWNNVLNRQTFYRWPLSPKNGPAWEVDYGCVITDLKVEPRKLGKQRGYWQITMEFGMWEPQEFGVDPTDPDAKENPFNVPVKVNFDSEDIKRSWPYDATTPTPKWYVNAAGEPLQNPPEVDDSYPLFTLTRNEKTYDFTTPQQYKNRCNLNDWLFWTDNQVRCRAITPERQYHPDWGVYWTVTYTFQIRPETWKDRILNAGTKQLVGGTLIPIVIGSLTVVDPVPLNADGTWSMAGMATPNYLEFQPYPKIDFTPFNFSKDDFASGFIY
jgi:hypothetical protein